MRQLVTSFAEVAGAGFIVAGLFSIGTAVGLIGSGVALIGGGVLFGRPPRGDW